MTLPGEQKLKTVASLVVSGSGLSVSAFVIRNPDENHEAFYRFLLRRNLRLPGLAYASTQSGDVYVTGRIPAAGRRRRARSTSSSGWCSTAADEPFNELLVMGFLTSMRRSGSGGSRAARACATSRRSVTCSTNPETTAPVPGPASRCAAPPLAASADAVARTTIGADAAGMARLAA